MEHRDRQSTASSEGTTARRQAASISTDHAILSHSFAGEGEGQDGEVVLS